MTPKEQSRLQVLNSLLEEHLTLDQATTLMGVSTRHTRRMLSSYRKEGVAAVAHGHRGRRAPNATPETVARDVVNLAGTKYSIANHTHLSELLSEREGIDIGRTTLRRILVNAGLNSPRRRRRPKHRVRRRRMPREGMLIQLDGSHHRWLGEDGPQFALLFAVDDATGAVEGALFCDQEDSRSYFLLLQGLIPRRGIPLALYTDRHPVFRHRSEYQPAGTATQFGRAMDELGIQLIFALFPQAKGRVERTAGTFEDRLISEIRLSGATTMEEAEAVLKQFLPRYNRRFRVPPQCSEPAFRPVGPELSLGQVLCFKHRRRVARDNTVKFHRHTLQVLPGPKRPSYAEAVVVVLEGLDGRLSLQHEGRIIASQEAPLSPRSLRSGLGDSPTDVTSPFGLRDRNSPRDTTSELLSAQIAATMNDGPAVDEDDVVEMTVSASPRKPTFLQMERWKAVQKAKRRGLSIRGMARELGIHRHTVRRYIDAESPPTRRPPQPASDTIAE